MKKYLSASDLLNQIYPSRQKSRKYKTKILFDISSMLIDYRLAHNLTQKKLAQFLDVTQGMVSKWESAEYNFSVEQVCKIAEKLGLTPEISFSDATCDGPDCWDDSDKYNSFAEKYNFPVPDCA